MEAFVVCERNSDLHSKSYQFLSGNIKVNTGKLIAYRIARLFLYCPFHGKNSNSAKPLTNIYIIFYLKILISRTLVIISCIL